MQLKRSVCLCLVLLVAWHAGAQDVVRFRLSKPYCLLNFLHTCNGDRNASQGLSAFVQQSRLLRDTAFQKILAAFQAIPLDYSYRREQFPEHRQRSAYGRIADMLVIAAVQADELAQFREKTIGLLPSSDHQALFRVLAEAMPYYDRLVWQPGYKKLIAQLDTLKAYQPRISRLFTQLNHFYNSSWPGDMPFVVTLYPVPGTRVGTAATPHINALCVGIRSGETDYDGVAGVVLHEMCHSLYNEQSAAVQQGGERLFLRDTTRYSPFAYSYFDEGLATACGNGWARESFNGRADTGEWYNDAYINRFGHALFPLVKHYLADGKAMDSTFIARAVKLFAALFPRAPYDYGLLLSNIMLYSDAETALERSDMQAALNRHFRIISYSSSAPILDPASLGMLEQSAGTQLVIMQKSNVAGLEKLKALFPQLAAALKGRKDEAYAITFYDMAKRPVIILNTPTAAHLEKALAMLRKAGYLDTARQYYPVSD